MTLQRKFGFLLAVLAAAVLANAVSALWALNFLERQVATPWNEIQRVQRGLSDVKRAISAQARIWSPDFPIRLDPVPQGIDASVAAQQFESQAVRIREAMKGLEQFDPARVRVGSSTSRNLTTRVAEAQKSGRAWLASPSPDTAAAASGQYFELHELIELIEASVLTGAFSEVDFGRSVRPLLVAVLSGSLAGVFLAGLLGVILVRRWVVRPVGVLRSAADALSRGDFSHRVPQTTNDELGQLSGEINHMAGMISAMQEERVDRERLAAVGEMVRRLAHNLRNPLAGIRSLAELTRNELPGDSPSRENQDRIVTTVDRFERWLGELLTATTPQHIVPQTNEVPTWIAAIIEPLRPLASGKDVELCLDAAQGPRNARFDPRHLEQAVVSVVTNAIQASPRGTAVSISTRMCEAGKSWEIRVVDRGQGVDPALVDKIFRPYFTTKRDGTGIGLAVAKQVVDQHGGRIWVEKARESAPGPLKGPGNGSGAAFVMRLPLAAGGEATTGVANPGHTGADGGEDLDRRRRGEPPVFDPADAQARRA